MRTATMQVHIRCAWARRSGTLTWNTYCDAVAVVGNTGLAALVHRTELDAADDRIVQPE